MILCGGSYSPGTPLQPSMTESNRTAKAARVRDNQRRSRARRKEYIQDLEQRLRAFEKLGVEATLEVQAAGRKVAAENALLRSLLRIRGVTDFEVEHYLRAHRITPGSEISVAASPSLSQSPSDTIARQSTEACRSKSADICPRPRRITLGERGEWTSPSAASPTCQPGSSKTHVRACGSGEA
ncbi:hypothetical protein CISG_08985 [Coccidioides immitis RMSCC 3703]|uniref:BZIP domain-containing protein n=1 Tax=Coccidioides immitis RMSCC 3703 TaxID=454286 RepID=A0A0J8RA90_COCIT|nr:hypothetical protein CISG_08985 [Coccidioides immitis RMSCC 3703]